MRHPKSHHVSEIEPKQKRRIEIRYKPACQHGTSKKRRQWTDKQSDASLLAISREVECIGAVLLPRLPEGFFFLIPSVG